MELGHRPHVASSGVHKFREHDTGGRWLGVEEGGAWVNMHFLFTRSVAGEAHPNTRGCAAALTLFPLTALYALRVLRRVRWSPKGEVNLCPASRAGREGGARLLLPPLHLV